MDASDHFSHDSNCLLIPFSMNFEEPRVCSGGPFSLMPAGCGGIGAGHEVEASSSLILTADGPLQAPALLIPSSGNRKVLGALQLISATISLHKNNNPRPCPQPTPCQPSVSQLTFRFEANLSPAKEFFYFSSV